MPFSRRFYPKRLTVMCAYILRMGGPGDRTHYPGVTSAMLYINLCFVSMWMRDRGAGTEYFCQATQQSWIILAMIPALSS
jgi:hypothetical protein